jgi:TRAP-type C4-dicarboxylate transport system permease small subunit
VEWTSRLPPQLERTIDFAASMAAFALSLFLTVSLTRYAYESYAGGVRSDTITATPLVFPKGALALGALLLTLQLAARLIRVVLGEPAETREAAADSPGFER